MSVVSGGAAEIAGSGWCCLVRSINRQDALSSTCERQPCSLTLPSDFGKGHLLIRAPPRHVDEAMRLEAD